MVGELGIEPSKNIAVYNQCWIYPHRVEVPRNWWSRRPSQSELGLAKALFYYLNYNPIKEPRNPGYSALPPLKVVPMDGFEPPTFGF